MSSTVNLDSRPPESVRVFAAINEKWPDLRAAFHSDDGIDVPELKRDYLNWCRAMAEIAERKGRPLSTYELTIEGYKWTVKAKSFHEAVILVEKHTSDNEQVIRRQVGRSISVLDDALDEIMDSLAFDATGLPLHFNFFAAAMGSVLREDSLKVYR